LNAPVLPPPVLLASTSDPEVLAATLRDAQIDYLRLAAGPFRADLAVIDLGPIRLQIATDDAHITRGAIAEDRSALLFGLDLPGDRARVNGRVITGPDIIQLAPGAPVFARVGGPIRWAALSFQLGAAGATITAQEAMRPGEFQVRAGGAPFAPLAQFMREAATLAARDAGRFALSAVRRAMAEDAARLAAAATGHPVGTDASMRALHRRVALVARAEAYLSERIAESLYSEDLQQALGVPMRSLHNAFVAVHGLSAHRYLRLRRLHLARAALRAGEASAARVKIAALSHGFWHLGRFAQEYHALFGELPSETAALPGR
jgi:AraC family ethanolamine operon transcriptional activator